MATRFSHVSRPSFVRDEHLDFLDDLFESYAVDVRRAHPMLCSAFQLAEAEAQIAVAFWASTFGQRQEDAGS